MEKQIIEEIIKDLCKNGVCSITGETNYCCWSVGSHCDGVEKLAKKLYNAGYRKQSNGNWLPSPSGSTNVYCSLCGAFGDGGMYCSHCSARMKGGE